MSDTRSAEYDARASADSDRRGRIKCVVWDLDGTVWDGILLEGDTTPLRPQILDVVRNLDERGILQSIASRGDYALASARLAEHGLNEFFLYPQINWDAKSASLRRIAQQLNIAIDALAFVDDQPYERAEINHALPDVLCFAADEVADLLDRVELRPLIITDESKNRRLLYARDAERQRHEREFAGAADQFVASLGLVCRIARAGEQDLARAEELTVRTHQLNSTGYTYSYRELEALRVSDRHRLLVADLEDRFGSYGTVGLALLECDAGSWTLKLLLASCRVISRGVGTLMLNHIAARAAARNVCLLAEFIPNERNRMMTLAFQLAGFTPSCVRGGVHVLKAERSRQRGVPDGVRVESADWD